MSFLLSWILRRTTTSIVSAIVGGIGIGVHVTKSYSAETVESTHLFRVIPEPNDQQMQKIDEIADDISYESLEKVSHNYITLLNGDKNYNDGNYVIYYGSEACAHCTGFIFGDQTVSDGSLFSGKNKMSDGTFMKAYASTRLDKDLKDKNIKFLMYEDIPDLNNKGDEYWTLPWSTWSSDDISKGRIKDQYIRNDKSALEFRKIFEVAQSKFGEKVSGTPTVIVYKQGIPIVFNQDKLPGLESRKQDEAMSNDLQLKEFIKYYYTQTTYAV